MSYTNYLNKLSDRRLIRLICLTTDTYPEEVIDFHIERTSDTINVTLTENVIFDNETEESVISDYFEITDFSITPYDYAGDQNESIRWRTWMYQLFGRQYAIDYMLCT